MYYDYYIYYFSYLSSLYSGYPLIIRLTVFMVVILAILVLFGIIRIFYIGYKINKKEKEIKNIRDHFEDRLRFVMESPTFYEVMEIRELLNLSGNDSKKWKIEILTDVILDIKNTVFKEGVLNEINYKNCLEAFRLMNFWEKKIRHSNLQQRRHALQVVGEMNNGVNTGVLSKSTYHHDDLLRKTARDVYTSQDAYRPFRFMEESFDESFTQLDKLRLHATLIKRSKEDKLPNLLRWINNSKNPNYTIFLLKEVAYFKQTEAIATLIAMLDKQENRDIRATIVITLGELGCNSCVQSLINRYPLESSNVREAIIHTMGLLKGAHALEFLNEAYHASSEGNLKLIIARAISGHGVEGENLLLSLNKEAKTSFFDKEITILNQVLTEQRFQAT